MRDTGVGKLSSPSPSYSMLYMTQDILNKLQGGYRIERNAKEGMNAEQERAAP